MKKARKQSTDSEMIHFRPGSELGALIQQFADQSGISRGEAAKRLTSLAIRGLDTSLYGLTETLMEYLYGAPSFDEAVHHVHIAIQDAAQSIGADIAEFSRDQRISAANQLVERYRLMRGFEDDVKEKRVQVRIIRTDE